MSRVEKFLNTFDSKKTAKCYRSGLNIYFRFIYGNMELEEAGERYFKEIRNYEEDVTNYFASIKDFAPKTVKRLLSTVKMFLMENDVELPEKFWRKLRGRKKGKAQSQDKVPSNAELRKIISHMPIHGKALYLTLPSSGMRIGEALSLKLDDLELEKDPAQINIKGAYTKTKNPRIAFVSSEAKEAIGEWLKVRGQYLEAASGKSHKYDKPIEDDRLFPFAWPTADMIFQNACKKAGFTQRDNSTKQNRHKLHPHVLRKFFRTRVGSVISVDVTEALMGHEGYLTEVYRKHSVEDLAKFYKQAEGVLLIFSDGESIKKVREEVQTQGKQLQTIINGVVAENLELKRTIAEMKKADAMVSQVLEYILQRICSEDLKQAVRETGMADRGWLSEDRLKLKAKLVEIGTSDFPTQPISTDGFQKIWQQYKKTIGSW